jgi:hypothetical protein
MPLENPWLWPSEVATARILDDTGRKLVPVDFDIAALRADLYRCLGDFLAKKIDTAEFRESHKKAAAETIEHARKLRQLMASSGNRLFDLQLSGAFELGDRDHVFAVLGTVIRETKKIASQGIDVVLVDAVHDARSGHKDYLVRLLVPIYERHFKQPARRGNEGSAPFPRFVEAVSAAMGQNEIFKVSRHTTRKSLAASTRANKT